MNSPRVVSLPPAAPPAAIRAAGAWLARRDRGLSAEESAAFAAWCAADPAHAAAVAELERTMSAFDRLPVLAPPPPGAPDPDALAPRRRRLWRPAVMATVLAAAAAVALVFAWPALRRAHSAGEREHLAAAPERVVLPDGSVATLNRGARLRVDYAADERRLRLVAGEAHFAVVKDAARPFVVHAGSVSARALGTAFNVRLDSGAVEVLVTEGRVQVAPPAAGVTAAPVVLTAGFRAVLPAAPLATSAGTLAEVAQVSADAIARQLAWQPRLRELSNAPLSEIVAAFNRVALPGAPQLVLGDARLADVRIGGSVYLEQPEAFVRLLERTFGIRAERSGGTVTLHRAP